MSVRILTGDALAVLRTLPEASAQMCVTSPPYFGLRSYLPDDHPDKPAEIGLEDTPDAYVARLVDVFREVRRVLRDDGTLWLNLGDSYAGSWGAQGRQGASGSMADRSVISHRQISAHPRKASRTGSTLHLDGIKPKDLIGIPWMVAFALRADGWFLRRDIIWAKPNPMPESVTDRPTSAHEYLFLLSKRERYFYDAEAIKEDCESGPSDIRKMQEAKPRIGGKHKELADAFSKASGATNIGRKRSVGSPDGRNARSVWTIPTQPFSAARLQGWDEDHDHYAVMPPRLVERCILAGSAKGDTVLDPFGGAGTTGVVADRLQRAAILIELNEKNARLARARMCGDAPLLAEVSA